MSKKGLIWKGNAFFALGVEDLVGRLTDLVQKERMFPSSLQPPSPIICMVCNDFPIFTAMYKQTLKFLSEYVYKKVASEGMMTLVFSFIIKIPSHHIWIAFISFSDHANF
jgi:hypothetical protein